MERCGECRAPLREKTVGRIGMWSCATCGTSAAYAGALATQMRPADVLDMGIAGSVGGRFGRRCPKCSRRMARGSMRSGSASANVALCGTCGVVEAPTGTLERLVAESEHGLAGISGNSGAALVPVMLNVMRQAEARQAEPPHGVVARLFYYLGLPVEQGADPVTQRPWVTWGAAIACIVFSVAWWLDGAPLSWAFHPKDPLNRFGLPILAAAVLHGGILHLFGNLYFLSMLGDDVEDRLGWSRYLGLLVAGHVAAIATHALVSRSPVVGASGFVSTALAYYALRFPHVRFQHFLWFYGRTASYVLTARQMVAAWFALQLVLLWDQVSGRGSVSAAAHIGGAAVGVFAWWWFEKRRVPAPRQVPRELPRPKADTPVLAVTTPDEVRRVLDETAGEIPTVLWSGGAIVVGLALTLAGGLIIGTAGFGGILGASALLLAAGATWAGGSLALELLRHAAAIVSYSRKYGELALDATELTAATHILSLLPVRPDSLPSRLSLPAERVERVVRRLRIAGLVELESDSLVRGSTRLRDRTARFDP